MIRFKWLLYAILLTALFGKDAKATTYTAASCSQAAVQAAVNLTSNGDTVLIPASSCPGGVTWGTNTTSDVALTNTNGNGFTLDGQGITITDNELKGNSNCQGTTSLISIGLSSNVFMRITGMTIIGVAPQANCGESANHIAISGSSQQVRVDHITFNPPRVTAINFSGYTNGVVDHCSFLQSATTGSVFTTEVHDDSWANVGSYGDNSWAQPDTLGQAGAIYIENNTYSYPNANDFPVGCFDEEAGGRVVFRFNTGCPFVGMHGLDSSGRLRSGRQYEIYGNAFTAVANINSNMYTGIFLRGGTGMIFENSFDDISGSPYITLVQVNSYRDTGGYAPWGPSYSAEGCDGRGPFDTNAGTVYASGTASASSSLDNLVANSSPGWSTNQWAANTYSIVNTTQGWGSTINSSTGNTIASARAQQSAGVAHNWSSGDSFQILKATACMDQVGRGAGSYISGTNPASVAAINQAADPLYEWLNSHNGTNQSAIASNNPTHVQANRDYYDWTSSFGGASGVGTGLLSTRPSSCATGVAYWATDQGDWNQSGSGGQGELFVCTSTNTWTLSYTPYTYPHPLTAGSTSSGTPPVAPSNLTATVQ